jgi:hypothetical protein
MTLAQLLSAPLPELETLRGMWIVMPAELGPALEQAQVDQTGVMAKPITLTDGRLALCADLLSEINGAFAVPFSRLDAANFELVEVVGFEAIANSLQNNE